MLSARSTTIPSLNSLLSLFLPKKSQSTSAERNELKKLTISQPLNLEFADNFPTQYPIYKPSRSVSFDIDCRLSYSELELLMKRENCHCKGSKRGKKLKSMRRRSLDWVKVADIRE